MADMRGAPGKKRRPRSDRIALTLRLDQKVYDAVKAAAEASGRTITASIEDAVKLIYGRLL